MSATAQPALSSPKLILIVDDTPVNLGVISGALKDFYKTKVATNGERALALASANEKPDLILLDVMMPGMDGYEVCSRLKADPATCEIPVIFLTGQTGAEDETRGFDVGAVDYVHKPFSPAVVDRKSTRLNSSHLVISYAVFCLKKKTDNPPDLSRRNTSFHGVRDDVCQRGLIEVGFREAPLVQEDLMHRTQHSYPNTGGVVIR